MRTTVIAASGIALAAAFLPGIAAAPQEKPGRGARVAVVAFHDSRLLTLCPVFGNQAVVSDMWTPKMATKVTVFYPPTGQQSIGLHFEPENSRRLMLPMPAGHSPNGSSSRPPAPAFVEIDRLARDIGVERRLAGQFRARGSYAVVDSPAEADFVFVAESIYIAMSAGTADPPPPGPRKPAGEGGRDSPARIFSDTEAEWNRRTEWRESLLGAPAPPAPAPPPPLPPFMGIIGGDRHRAGRRRAAHRYLGQHAGREGAHPNLGVRRRRGVACRRPRDDRDLRQQDPGDVGIGYYPSNGVLDGSYRRIRVAVDCDGCSVRARRGYRAGAVR